MKDQAIRTSIRNDDELAKSYLHQLQMLADEISLAMNAIAANAFTSFKQSVDKQEMLCCALTSMEQRQLVVTDHSIEADIRETTEAIRHLNLQYAALLKHSGRSMALLASLHRSFTGQFQQEARGIRLKHQTWSCEA